MAGRIVNGDFEAVTGGELDSWTSSPGSGVASASVAPTVVGGKHSAKLAAGGGLLWQTVSTDGIRHFAIEMDFAVLDTASTDVRSFSVVTYSTAGGSHNGSDNIDSIRVYTTAANRQEIQIYDKGGFQNTGLFAKATADIKGDLRFDDGETPVVNHLKIVGTGYGTASQAVTITLTGGEKSGSYKRRLCYVGTNSAVKDVGLYSAGSAADYLVDNLSIEPQPAPPPGPDLAKEALRLMGGAEEIVFVERALYSDGHYYANFGGWSDDPDKFLYPPDGSRLLKLNLRTKQLTVLLDVPKGNIRDPRVHYDGGKILFAYRKGGTRHYNLYEINTDGTGLRQLTSGDWDDTDPAYLPDGGIVFVSSRGRRFIPCNHVQAAILYRMDADGGNLLCLSANSVRDDRPAVLPDGRVIYTRWEYVDSAIGSFRDLWVMNPDGTGQMILFGGTVRPPELVFSKCDALPIPGTNGKVVSVFSPPVGTRENAGNVMVVDLRAGPDEATAARQISPERDLRYYYFWPSGIPWFGGGRTGFRDPYPLSEDCFLVTEDKSLLILDGNGMVQEFYRADKMVHDPRVIRPRPRERVTPSRIELQKTTGRMVLADVYHGRGKEAEGIEPGAIKQLLVLEDLPKPISYYSLPGLISMDGTHTLRRVLGTVPVEADGSASFEVPALRALYFVALDEKGLAIKRMQSYTMVMPGEAQGCVGCHEPRTQNISPTGDHNTLMAMARPPSPIEPVPGVADVFDYPRDIQPIWDRHCVTCHSAEKPEGRVVLTGDRNEWFTQSYYALFAYNQISDMFGRYNTEFRNHQPYGFGTGASPLMNKIDGSHYEVKLTKQEYDTVRLWIEASAYFTGTYAVYNHSENAVAGALANNAKVEIGKPLDGIVYNRCLWCHDSAATIGRRVRKGRVNAPKHCWNLYNLSFPEKSMILRAPLAKEAGGYGWCKDQYGQTVVFRDTQDPDYQAILRAIRAAKARQEKAGRYDMPGFRPNEHYVRWMKRFGVLPENFDLAKDPINPYETDRAYWRSLWHQPAIAGASASGESGE
ncbi:MAG: PD40 domain-containing protein [Pirellulaceae bacterium]|nr:PD40 domain-containing protein [Pirellulaceae bacterium]